MVFEGAVLHAGPSALRDVAGDLPFDFGVEAKFGQFLGGVFHIKKDAEA
jgi:hypothetical protein